MTRRTSVLAGALVSVVVLLVSIVAVRPADAGTPAPEDVPGMSSLSDLTCGPDGTCLAVGSTDDDVGAVVVLRAGGPSGPVRAVPGTEVLFGIACPPGGTCNAVGRSARGGVVVEVSPDGTPGPARSAPGTSELREVACPSATTCIAIGNAVVNPDDPLDYQYRQARFTVISNGHPARAQWLPPEAEWDLRGIACPTPTRCLAPGYIVISVFTDTGAGWTVAARYHGGSLATGFPRDDISCASTTLCMTTAREPFPPAAGVSGPSRPSPR